MGIPGLTSFINRNSIKYFENHQLKDTLVILDGYAVTNFLYRKYENQTSPFGGDYDIMAKVYIDLINLFLRCNVTPVFVFDGAYEQRKIETIMSRMSQRIQSYSQPFKTGDCMPYFASDIIFDILNDMDIPHVQCDFEADAEIVALAKLLNCPVISRDSDFYLNTVPYIPLDMIMLDLKSTENVINCQIYNVEKLLDEFGGLKISYLPLVAILLGNDYIRPDTFCGLLRLNPGMFNCGLKLKKITEWLRKQKDENSAIHNMTSNLHGRDYVLNQIKNIIKEYKSVDSKYLSSLFLYKRMNKYQESLKHLLKENEKRILPQWLELNYRKGTINSELMTIYTMKKIFFKVQIEDYRKPPYYEVTFKILERLFGLLFTTKNSISSLGRKNDLNIGQYKIKPYIYNPYVPLSDLNKIDLEHRKNIILDVIGIKNFNGVPKEWELFVLSLIYWAVRSNNRNSKQMHALIVCAITLNIIDNTKIHSQNESFEDITDKNIIKEHMMNVKKEDCKKAIDILSEYRQVQQCNDKSLYYKIIHSLAQFQSCVYFLMILNSIVDFPFSQCRVENFFKGSFLYNLCVKMENYDPEKFISQHLFDRLDSLNNVYKSIISHLETLIPISKRRIIPDKNQTGPREKKPQNFKNKNNF